MNYIGFIMNKKLLLLPFICSLLSAKTVEPKVFRAIDSPRPSMQQSNYSTHYQNSSHMESTDDKVISSTAEASAQITVISTVQVTTELTAGGRHGGSAIMSFLDNNRIEITEDIAKGEGEHLHTLLRMMKINNDTKNLTKIQDNFINLIYLTHNDFLDKLESLV